MHAWEAIQKSLDYIEKNLNEEISIQELAKASGLSEFYFQRLFSKLVKQPVAKYIKLRRLAKACKKLENKENRILDIALDCGFTSHEAFTRVFKENYKMTPEEFRKNPKMLNHVQKPDLSLHYVMVDEGVPIISQGLVLEMNKKRLEEPIPFLGVTGVVPIEGQMMLGEEPGVDLLGEIWKAFHKTKHLIPNRTGKRELGVAYLGEAPSGHFTYFAGAQVQKGTEDKNFQSWELPAREYVVCGFEAQNFEELVTVAINKAVKYSALWLERHNLKMEEYSPEVYYDSSPDGRYMELWMPVVKI